MAILLTVACACALGENVPGEDILECGGTRVVMPGSWVKLMEEGCATLYMHTEGVPDWAVIRLESLGEMPRKRDTAPRVPASGVWRRRFWNFSRIRTRRMPMRLSRVDMPAPFIGPAFGRGSPGAPLISRCLRLFNTDGLSYAYMLFYEGSLAGELLGAVDVAE